MEGLDVICAQNWIEQFRYNLAHHEVERGFFDSYSLASLSRRNYVNNIATNFVFYAFDWDETAQGGDVWRHRRDDLLSSHTLTR